MQKNMKTGITVHEAMTKKPVTAYPDDTIQECAKIMAKEEVGSIVIKEHGELVGIISEKDIVERVVAKGLDMSKVKARDIMIKNLITIEPNKDLYDALVLMGYEEIRKLPVVQGKKLLGLLTAKDILKIEPALFDIFSTKIEELREEEEKPLKYIEGTCNECGFRGPVQKVNNKFICNSCMK